MLKKITQKLRGKTGFTFVAKLLVVGFGYLFALYCTNLFGASIYGLFSLSFMMLNLSKTMSVFGFDVTLLRYGSEAYAKQEFGTLRDLYIKCLSFTLVVSIVMGFGLFLASEFICHNIFSSPELIPYMKITAICLIPYALLSLNSELIKASGNSVLYMLVNEGVYFGLAIVAIQGLSYLLSAPNIMVGFVVAIFILMLFSFYWIMFKIGLYKVARVKARPFRQLLKTSCSFLLAGSSVFLKNWSDIFLLGVFLDPREVGIYSVIFKISKTITIPVTTINAIQAPKFSALFGKGKINELAEYVKKTNRQIVFLSLPVVLIIALFPSFLIQFFGDEFTQGSTALVVLAFGFLFKSIAGSTSLLLQMTDNEKRFMQVAITSLVFGLLINVLLIPEYGVLGAAVTSTVVHLFWNGLCAFFSSKELGFNTMRLR